MSYRSEQILDSLIINITKIDEVRSIGISGSKTPLPKSGEGDIDVFIYCNVIPDFEKRSAVLNQLGEFVQDCKINVFEGGHWGSGDYLTIHGIDTWLMYFTVDGTFSNIAAIMNGDFPDKLDNYYYPIGRCAMLKNITVLYDKNGFLHSLKKRINVYPDELSAKLIHYHLNKLGDVEDLERAISRKDVLFYHFAIDLAIDHFLQALFAMNKTYFPSRKRTPELINTLNLKPVNCNEKLLEVVRLGSSFENISQSYELWSQLVDELRGLING
jgi:hypothetical protein